ncbi:MAG: hypothetical protein LAN64_19595 [Acidobacteriia bacterium]|nr:hypothetical protein [Terriglobia bacterium]
MAPMRTRRILALIWLCFVARLAFYAAMLPLWEGYDEWAHFAVVRRVAGGEILVSREARIQQDVQASLDLAPVPYELRRLPPPAVIQDDFWRLPESERARRAAAFAAMPESWRAADGRLAAYEALQPPLYYWIAAPALKLAPAASLGALPMMVATSSSSAGLALNSEKSCTPAGRLARKRSKLSNAWSGAAVSPRDFSSAGMSSVSSSLARAEVVERNRPWCQRRTIAAAAETSLKPSRRRARPRAAP